MTREPGWIVGTAVGFVIVGWDDTPVTHSEAFQGLPPPSGEWGKRAIIESMIVHSPGDKATERVVAALETFPLLYLLQACVFPTRIWLLDRDERVSSAGILTPAMRQQRWHLAGLSVDDCEGMVELAPDYLAMVTTWSSALVVRHEFAHVLTTFLSRAERARLARLYQRARALDHFVEPLARESIGEYLACALSYVFFDDLAERLGRFDSLLRDFAIELLRQAEKLSLELDQPDGHPACAVLLPVGASS